jgi:hypothetical protein
MRTPTLGASPAPMAPMAKTAAAASMIVLRPSLSESAPLIPAPTTAPSSNELTIKPSRKALSWKFVFMKSSAPEMIPVS